MSWPYPSPITASLANPHNRCIFYNIQTTTPSLFYPSPNNAFRGQWWGENFRKRHVPFARWRCSRFGGIEQTDPATWCKDVILLSFNPWVTPGGGTWHLAIPESLMDLSIKWICMQDNFRVMSACQTLSPKYLIEFHITIQKEVILSSA